MKPLIINSVLDGTNGWFFGSIGDNHTLHEMTLVSGNDNQWANVQKMRIGI